MTTTERTHVIEEPLAPGMTRTWQLDDVLWEGETAFQHIVIARSNQGVSLFCDEDRQSTEFSQLVYHEALLVPALLLADKVESVLIIGSSEGVASQISVAAGAARVDHVDIDQQAVVLCAEHLPYGYTPTELAAAERGDGPIRMHYADGWEFLVDPDRDDTRYDVVLVDLPDEREHEQTQHNRLYGVEFLNQCRAVLAPGGVVVTQAGCPTLWRNGTLVRSWRRFNEVFGTVAYFGSDEHEWAYLFGTAEEVADPTALMIERLATCPYRPMSIDAATLTGCSVPPHSVRHSR